MDSHSLKRRKARALRRALLAKLIKEIESGKFLSERVTPDSTYPLHTSQRREYQNPRDRDTYNYGYMDIKEMEAGTPNVW